MDLLSIGATGTQVTTAATSKATAIPLDNSGSRARRVRIMALANCYVAPKAASVAGALGNNPITTDGSTAAVVVAHTAHGRSVGDSVIVAGATAVGGITAPQLNITATITAVTTNTYTYSSTGTSNSATSGGGATVTDQFVTGCTVNEALLSPNEDLMLDVRPFSHIVSLQETAAAKFNITPLDNA